jgi:hypothetical protein
MKDTMPHPNQTIVSGGAGRFNHPQSEDSSPFWTTGGTKRQHNKG